MTPEPDKIPDKTVIKHYPDGGIGVIPGKDNPIIKEAQGHEFFRLSGSGPQDSGYATAPNEDGIRLRFPNPGDSRNFATLITERINPDGSIIELSRQEFGSDTE